MSISKRSLIFVFAAITAFAIFASARDAAAQNYRGLEMPEVYFLTPRPYLLKQGTNEAKRANREKLGLWKREGNNPKAITAIRTGQSKVKEVLAAGGDVTADAETRKFLEDYSFPSMTQTDPDTLSSLGQKRQEFLKNYLNARVTGNARSKMLDFSVEKLQGYSADATLHPSARVNAIVLLSQLTDRALARGQAPIASAKAFKALLSIFSGADPNGNPEFVRVAALSGLKNQLELNSKSNQQIAPAAKTQLVDAAMKFMAAPADRNKDAAAYWNKRQAIQLAGILKDAKTLPALLAILNDEATSHELKMEVIQTIAKTGAMNSDPKSNSQVLASICKFAGTSVTNEATRLQALVKQMERENILFGDFDIRAQGIDFQPEDDGAAGGGGFDGFGGGGDPGGGGGGGFAGGFGGAGGDGPLVELPNYQLQIARNRLRALSVLCGQAIGTDKQTGLRPNLDTKAETLASSTVSQLRSLLQNSSVGLYDVSERRRPDEPTPQELDQKRKSSYVDQMIKVCENSSAAITDLLANYTTE